MNLVLRITERGYLQMSGSPIALSAIERDIIIAAAQPIDQALHPEFFAAVMAALAAYPVTGEGLVHRIVRDLQRQFMRAPAPHELRAGKYAYDVV